MKSWLFRLHRPGRHEKTQTKKKHTLLVSTCGTLFLLVCLRVKIPRCKGTQAQLVTTALWTSTRVSTAPNVPPAFTLCGRDKARMSDWFVHMRRWVITAINTLYRGDVYWVKRTEICGVCAVSTSLTVRHRGRTIARDRKMWLRPWVLCTPGRHR